MAGDADRALKRLLVNGPLTGLPTRRADAEWLLRLAAARFEAGKTYGEAEVNDVLREWLATFSAPYGIDHVSMRRYLVDARYLVRDTSGSAYRVDVARHEAQLQVDPAQVLEDIRQERAARKRQRAASEAR